ncbi:sensor histidine kinase [Mycetocola zhadangensis]|uniref:histidine kinase n=1 Tax=Mycetocola zhadangensis TaxID=1164595 RepID=A0A3L7J6L5_9MICO|nr:histidine kinase [Mycetocola zhadangensis]RLQ86005.1 sensor histidine kinase [Mycetocola zhadangensis]GGE87545.1 two-component sensor histidine kinase [Mycetocola zhadangensis]
MFRRLSPPQITVDIVVAALFGLIVSGIELPMTDGMPPVIVIMGMTVALALRRISPGLALVVAWAAVAVQLTSGMEPVPSNIAIIAVLYATGCYGETWLRWAGLVSAIGGGVLAATYLSFFYSPGGLDLRNLGSVPGIVLGSLIGSVAAIFVFTLSWTVGLLVRTSQAAKAESIRRQQAQQEQRLAQQSVVVEQERNRIARDMHDVVAHSLAVVIAQADGARYAQKNNPEAMDTTLATIADTARGALGDVRLLLAELRHRQGEGPQPLLTDLDALFEQMRSAGLDIHVTKTGMEQQLPAGHQISIYRILQEALTNALRHGNRFAPVDVGVTWQESGVAVRVDNAVASVPFSSDAFGHGVPGMRERAALVGGWLTAEQSDNGRFVVTAYVPVPNTAQMGVVR